MLCCNLCSELLGQRPRVTQGPTHRDALLKPTPCKTILPVLRLYSNDAHLFYNCLITAVSLLFFDSLITDFDPINSPYQGCFSTEPPVLQDASFNATSGNMTDASCRAFCQTTAAGAPYTYFGIQNGQTCRCGNTSPRVPTIPGSIPATPNESLCNIPNSGDSTQAGGGPNAVNVWLVAPTPNNVPSSSQPAVGSPTISLPVGQSSITGLATASGPQTIGTLPGAISSVSAPISGVSSGGVPPVSTPIGGVPSGAIPSVSVPIGGASSGAIPSVSVPIGGASSGAIPSVSVPIGGASSGAIPSVSAPIGGTPSDTIPSIGAPISGPSSGPIIAPSSLPNAGGVSSQTPQVSGGASSVPSNAGQSTGLPSPSIPSAAPSSPTSSPIFGSGIPTPIGSPLPAGTPATNPQTLISDNDPEGTLLGCVSTTGKDGQSLFKGPSAYNSTFTQITCRRFCIDAIGGPYRIYALEQGNLCRCSAEIDSNNVVTDPYGCNVPSAGNPNEVGGGRGRAIVFTNDDFAPPDVRPISLIMCSKLALHNFVIIKVGTG
ncbi:hypothetical protein HBI88_020100 [Parastagonospora nodorum]|nr:hypothetical protein HBI97_083930 [Parastagonospora nodorum]KAH5809917.1 hypothetical protein HBI96_095070 [Parastagonospora nodorum]KAH5810294.1 hypothetical protein HBI94_156510 [Parastagonospora nodorum]KAH5839701.1 hypothetical protein HBI93_042290 [Parastagonospora nodorum]KAH5878737.1 hypothetical protein HBI92_151130 [Parastagonospora nodorum]